jgi:small subunit ribosomal protein S24e
MQWKNLRKAKVRGCVNSTTTCGSVSMKVNIISKEQNPLLKRKEVTFSVDHAQNGGTPSRVEVGKQLASLLKTNPELVYVKSMETKTGKMFAIGEANVYDSIKQAKFVEPEHIIARNTLPEKPEESQAPEEATEEEEEE